ncbi:hypothetical protein ACLOJK_037283, partial [Asimina triloba]
MAPPATILAIGRYNPSFHTPSTLSLPCSLAKILSPGTLTDCPHDSTLCHSAYR